jgi:hypothetical protein
MTTHIAMSLLYTIRTFHSRRERGLSRSMVDSAGTYIKNRCATSGTRVPTINVGFLHGGEVNIEESSDTADKAFMSSINTNTDRAMVWGGASDVESI